MGMIGLYELVVVDVGWGCVWFIFILMFEIFWGLDFFLGLF